jgi:hypothetical protein
MVGEFGRVLGTIECCASPRWAVVLESGMIMVGGTKRTLEHATLLTGDESAAGIGLKITAVSQTQAAQFGQLREHTVQCP